MQSLRDLESMMKASDHRCPNCGASSLELFFEIVNIPVHSVILHHSQAEAVAYPRGDVVLGFCKTCGFITNTAFDPGVHEYASEYESTQAYSPTFNTFHQTLAADLVDRYALHAKKIVEIGCGQGEFLKLLCENGRNDGIGFDPAYTGPPLLKNPLYEINFIADFYSEKYKYAHGDFFCCKMTLEHIPNTKDFMATVRRAIRDQADSVVFFQVPNARYVFGETAFWDVYYEHCSYFTAGSLARLFRGAGFDVIDLWTGYDDQYIMIEARPAVVPTTLTTPQEDDLADFTEEVRSFTSLVPQKIQAWRDIFKGYQEAEQKVVLWGGGSKAVAFLTAANLSLAEIERVVDINPRKNNTYLAGFGQKVVLPETLHEYQPDVVIVMNPIYLNEIRDQLDQMGLHPLLRSVQEI